MLKGKWNEAELLVLNGMLLDPEVTLDEVVETLQRDRMSVARKIKFGKPERPDKLREECHAAIVEYDRVRRQRTRDEEKRNSTSHNAKKSWSMAEDIVMLELVQDGHSLREIRDLLDRTTASVQNRGRLLRGVDPKELRKYEEHFSELQKASMEITSVEKWNAAKDAKLIKCMAKKMDAIALATAFNANPSKLYIRYNYLKSKGLAGDV